MRKPREVIVLLKVKTELPLWKIKKSFVRLHFSMQGYGFIAVKKVAVANVGIRRKHGTKQLR